MNEKDFRILGRLLVRQAPDCLRDELQTFLDKVYDKYKLPKAELFAIVVSSDLHDWLEDIGLHIPVHARVSEN